MKFNELSKEQQQVLTAWMNGETMQYQSTVSGEWYDVTAEEEMGQCLFDRKLRVKPKEPVVKHTFTPVFVDGVNSYLTYGSIKDILATYYDAQIHSLIMKTYHDGVFIKAEVIPKLELILSLKGLV